MRESSAHEHEPAADAVRALTPAVVEIVGAEAFARAAWVVRRSSSGETVSSQLEQHLQTPILPGSLYKVVVARAALEQHEDGGSVVCARRLSVHGRAVDCVHPPVAAPIDLPQALALSCNTFFVRLAARLDRAAWLRTATRMGVPSPGDDVPVELLALGLEGVRLPATDWRDVVWRAARDRPDGRPTAGPVAAGLRAAAATGSAAVLADGWADTLAKTGTVQTPSGSQGLVVAQRPEADLDVLVRVNGGAGRDAAAIAREVLARHEGHEPPLRIGRVPDAGSAVGTSVRVETVALEPYVEAVVAAEGTPEMRPPVLEALAVAARTFAAAHRNRHADDGFDLCDTTHCQVTAAAPWSAARVAAGRTRGLVLARHGRVVPVQYAAACAGRLHDPRVIWGGDEPGHGLTAVEPHPHPVPQWSSDVSVDDLMRVLERVGVRGGPLRALTVRAYAEDGLPRLVGFEGLHPDVLSAGVFRTAMGRTLGWHVLKSHHWSVERTSRGYRFHGKGKGHGVGLCLAGAQALATASAAGGGATAEDILSAYLPGLHVRSLEDAVRLRVSTASEGLAPDVASLVWRTLARLRADLQLAAPRRIEIVEHPTIEAYQRATGRAWWTAARTRFRDPVSARIDLVPFDHLVRSGRLDEVLRHELAHALTDATLGDAPLWAREGLAVVLAGEVPRSAVDAVEGPCPDDAAIAQPGSAEAMREQYVRAAACVQRHLDSGGTWRGLR